jgi:1-acyl-sn-glycerol-3-phosphate acyltransferase
MILPSKTGWFEAGFTRYMGRLMRRQFHAVRVAGLAGARALPRSTPLLWLPTHSSWWDGFCDYYLLRTILSRDVYVMMEANELARFRFFARIGAFSVDRSDPRDGLRACALGAELLRTAGRALLLYPQGRLRPVDRRPLEIEGGAVWIARRVPECRVVLVAHRYEYLSEEKAHALVRIGAPIPARDLARVSRREARARIEEALLEAAEQLRACVLSEELSSFETVIAGSVPAHDPREWLRRGRR